MSTSDPEAPRDRVHNRLSEVLEHVVRYSIDGTARLARDAGVSQSAVSRLINGFSSPSFRLICALTAAIERELGRSIDPRELVSFDGRYPTPTAEELTTCDHNGYFVAVDEESPSRGRVEPGCYCDGR